MVAKETRTRALLNASPAFYHSATALYHGTFDSAALVATGEYYVSS